MLIEMMLSICLEKPIFHMSKRMCIFASHPHALFPTNNSRKDDHYHFATD